MSHGKTYPASTSLEALVPLVRAVFPDVAIPVAVIGLRQAASEFCRQTRAWREVIDFRFRSEPARIEPQKAPGVVFKVHRIVVDGRELEAVPFADLPLDTFDQIDPNHVPVSYSQVRRGEFVIYPAKACDARAEAFFAPEEITAQSTDTTIPATFPITEGAVWDDTDTWGGEYDFEVQNRIPTDIARTYAGAIANGALALLYMQTGDGFAPDRANVHRAAFIAAINDARSSHYFGEQRAVKRTAAYFL